MCSEVVGGMHAGIHRGVVSRETAWAVRKEGYLENRSCPAVSQISERRQPDTKANDEGVAMGSSNHAWPLTNFVFFPVNFSFMGIQGHSIRGFLSIRREAEVQGGMGWSVVPSTCLG